MKKSLIALLISSVVFLSACDDKEKTQQATQEISQLKSDLEHTKTELGKANSEIVALKAQLEKVQSEFPALNVEIETIFNKKEILKHEQDPQQKDEFFNPESSVFLAVSMPKTNVEWLNNLLYDQLIKSLEARINSETDEQRSVLVEKGKERETALKLLQEKYERELSSAKEEQLPGFSEIVDSVYLWQRNNIVAFLQEQTNYNGGSRLMSWRDYLNIDKNKRIIIKLSDLLSDKSQKALHDILWRSYVNAWEEKTGDSKDMSIEKGDLTFSENFYFSDQGITFVYPPYSLGHNYILGEFELTLPWEIVNPHLPKEYQFQVSDFYSEF